MGTENRDGDKARERKRERKEARKRLKYGRSAEAKGTLERVLIVSEGTKTEPIYFEKLVEHLKLVTADIKVTGAKDSCPQKVVQYAIGLYEETKDKKNAYDLVFCVIDKDSHVHYEDALLEAKEYSPKNILYIINSIPCFELWLLLHYTYTSKPYQKKGTKSKGGKSICDVTKDELKKYLPSYVKNISNLSDDELAHIFNDTTIQTAIKRSEQLMEYCISGKTDNPSTKTHELVLKLQEIKKRPFKDS